MGGLSLNDESTTDMLAGGSALASERTRRSDDYVRWSSWQDRFGFCCGDAAFKPRHGWASDSSKATLASWLSSIGEWSDQSATLSPGPENLRRFEIVIKMHTHTHSPSEAPPTSRMSVREYWKVGVSTKRWRCSWARLLRVFLARTWRFHMRKHFQVLKRRNTLRRLTWLKRWKSRSHWSRVMNSVLPATVSIHDAAESGFAADKYRKKSS